MHHLPSRYIPCDGRLTASTYFNPHSPHRERLAFSNSCSRYALFQSTLPAWGATQRRRLFLCLKQFQSTLPAWGATAYGGGSENYIVISIHAPREGSDLSGNVGMTDALKFQSTLPARGATDNCIDIFMDSRISIHAPREGSDRISRAKLTGNHNFNPRSPHGERQASKPNGKRAT